MVSARSSMMSRQTRFKKPNTPLTPCMLQGFAASSGPMNISYSRSESAPYSVDDRIGVDDIAAALRHLLVVLAEDHALVDELLKRLRHADDAAIVQHLVPEARIQEMQHGMLGAADVEIDWHPSLFDRRIDRRAIVFRIEKSQIVPARTGPLRHRVGLALVALAINVLGTANRRALYRAAAQAGRVA